MQEQLHSAWTLNLLWMTSSSASHLCNARFIQRISLHKPSNEYLILIIAHTLKYVHSQEGPGLMMPLKVFL